MCCPIRCRAGVHAISGVLACVITQRLVPDPYEELADCSQKAEMRLQYVNVIHISGPIIAPPSTPGCLLEKNALKDGKCEPPSKATGGFIGVRVYV